MDRAQVCVLEQTNKIGLGSFLKGKNCSGLKSEIGFKVLGNLP
jgi:hypothetical protein